MVINMITLAIFNYFINIVDYILTHALNSIYVKVADLGTMIGALQVPATIYNILSLCIYFLPMGTIIVLFNITIVIVLTMVLVCFIRGLMDFVKHMPLM